MAKIIYIDRADRLNGRKYQSFLESAKDSYFAHSIFWRNVIESQGRDKGIIVAASQEGNIVGAIPLFIYKCRYGNIINSVPYPGPLGGVVIGNVAKGEKELIFGKLMAAVNALAKDNDCTLVTVISSPFWPNDELYRKYFKPDFELENYTLYIDLAKPIKTTSHFRNNLKRMLERAAENNLSIEMASGARQFDDWYCLHEARHKSLGLEPSPKSFLKKAFLVMRSNKSGELFLVKGKDEIQAGCLVFYQGQVLDTYMISGSREAYNNGAIYFLIDFLIGWAKERGLRYFNWQSSKPRGSGPYNFKVQWGSREAKYYFFTKVYKPIDKILSLGRCVLAKAYEWHFVVPYDQVDSR